MICIKCHSEIEVGQGGVRTIVRRERSDDGKNR